MPITTMAVAGAVLFLLLAVLLVAAGGNEAVNEFGRFSRKPLLNKTEKKLVRELDVVIPDIFGPEARLLSQVSYGEFLKGEDRSSHARINQKRADFIVVDGNFEVLCAIEYQGAGHFGRGEKARESAEYRDRVKRAACASAGVRLVEIPQKFSTLSLRDLIAPTKAEVAE